MRERFRRCSVALWSTDKVRRVTFALGNLYGILVNEQAVGRLVDEVVDPRLSAAVVDRHLMVLAGDEQCFRFRTQGHTLDIRMAPIRDASGTIAGVAGAAIDVTELARAEVEAGRVASLLDAALESTADGLLVVDTTHRVSRINQRFLAMWGLSPDQIRPDHVDEEALALCVEQLEDPEAFMLRVRELYSDHESEAFDVLTFKDGRVFERYTKPQRLGNRVVGRVWSFRDVTERERLLRRLTFLTDASYLLESLDVQKALVGVAELSIRTIADACAVDLLAPNEGGPRRLFAGTRPFATVLPPELTPAVLSASSVLENTAQCSLLAVPLTSPGVIFGAISFAREASRRRFDRADLQLCEELAHRASLAMENARLYAHAQQALNARDEFLGVAAHEVRSPLHGIQLAAQLLADTRDLPSSARKPIEIILRQTRMLSRLVDDLLDVTRIRSGKTHLELSEVDLGEVVREVAARSGSDIVGSGSSVTISIESGVKGIWDHAAIEQIVSNLLSNAIKFGLGKLIEIQASARDGIATLVVADHGIGIPPERVAAIFEPFERVVTVRQYRGLGLGLYIVKQVVAKMGGTVHVSSELGVGTTFAVDLPQSQARRDEPASAGESSTSSRS